MEKIISQIKKLKNFKTYLIPFVGVITLTGVGVWIFQSDYPTIVKNRFFQGKVTSYMGVKIGDDKENAHYKLGIPNVLRKQEECPEVEMCEYYYFDKELPNYIDFSSANAILVDNNFNVKNGNWWLYVNKYNTKSFVKLKFHKEKIHKIACGSNCETILGVDYGMQEKNVLFMLGNPDTIIIENGVKSMTYKKYNLQIDLMRGVVDGISIFSK